MPDSCIELICVDPPYNTTQLDFENDLFLNAEFLKELKRVSKNGFMVCFSKQPFTSLVVMQKVFRYRYELIWEKTLPTRFLDSGWRPLDNHENILIFFDEKATYNPQMEQGKSYYKTTSQASTKIYGAHEAYETISNGERYPKSIIKSSNASHTNRFHPTEKPTDLMEWLINTYSNPDDLICDPFAGSGSTLVACKKLNRRFIGIEISPEYCTIAEQRLKQGVLPL